LHVKLENAYSPPKIWVFGGFYPQNGELYEETPKVTSLGGNTSYDVSIIKIGPLLRARREPKNKAKKIKKLKKGTHFG